MNIKNLKEIIADLPDDMEIIMQRDSEGNGFSPLAGADPDNIYIPESTWSGEVYDLEWSAGDCCLEEDEWKRMKEENAAVLVMSPVN